MGGVDGVGEEENGERKVNRKIAAPRHPVLV